MLRPRKSKEKKRIEKEKRKRRGNVPPLPPKKKGNDPAQGKRKIKNKGNLKKPITSFERNLFYTYFET